MFYPVCEDGCGQNKWNTLMCLNLNCNFVTETELLIDPSV